MSCKNGCLPPQLLHVINLDTTDIYEAWTKIFRETVVYGSAMVKINYQDPEKIKKFWGESPVDNIENVEKFTDCTACNGVMYVRDLQSGPDSWAERSACHKEKK